jgi:hypothetical protein
MCEYWAHFTLCSNNAIVNIILSQGINFAANTALLATTAAVKEIGNARLVRIELVTCAY